MIETHPFGDFIPKNAKYLIVGSFPGKPGDPGNTWFYGAKRNQFWKIIGSVYKKDLPDKKYRKKFVEKMGFAITDVIKKCERTKGSNLDQNLKVYEYNIEGIRNILVNRKIVKVYFTSKLVESTFKILFKDYKNMFKNKEFIALPLPSPRYVYLSLTEKIAIYKKLLPEN